MFHGRNKHIDIKYHYIRDLVREKEIEVEYWQSEGQVADIFTKHLKVGIFFKLKELLGMTNINLREDVRN